MCVHDAFPTGRPGGSLKLHVKWKGGRPPRVSFIYLRGIDTFGAEPLETENIDYYHRLAGCRRLVRTSAYLARFGARYDKLLHTA